MTSRSASHFPLNRRTFLAAGMPLLWAARRWAQQGAVAQELSLVPKGPPKDPARTLRDYCLETQVSPETAVIIYPAGDEYGRIARRLSERLAPECGGRLEIMAIQPEDDRWPSHPRHLILLGNAINHPLIFRLYVNHYTLVDEYFPGPGGEFVHTVHNPFGDARNVVILGASDVQGAETAGNVLVLLIRKNGPKLSFTLHSRSPRLPSSSPSDEDFAFSLAKRKEQIEAGDLPWVAMDYGMLYHLTGDARWGATFRDLHLYAARSAREHHSWPRTVFDNDFYLYRLLTAWDLIEESPIFSDYDRRTITHLCLEISRYVNGMPYLRDFFNGRLRMLNNHQTFPAISIFMAHRYFSKYYGWEEFALTQMAVSAIFAMHNTSWRPNDNDEGVAVRTHRHLVNYSLIQGDYTYLQTGRARLLADWIIMVTDNRADTLAFGDAGEYDGVYQGGTGKIQDQYCLVPLSLAAWFYRDGRYAWARDWFRKGLDWKDRLDFDQLLCRKYGWQERYGITEWEFYLGWLYRAGLQPVEPTHLLGVAVARYDDAGRVIAGAEDIQPEETFDKLTFRAGFQPRDEYLALEGVATMPHSHDDANCVMRLSWNDRLWIVEGDEMKSLRRYHNGIVVVRNGEHFPSFGLARLKASGMSGPWGISQSLLPDDNGLDWERTILWRKGAFFVVWDRLRAAREGDYSMECRWRTLGDVSIDGRELRVVQDGETFSIINADVSALSLSYRDALYEPDREDYRGYEHAGNGYQRILRQSQWRKMAVDDGLQYVNLLQVTTGKQAFRPSVIAGHIIKVEGEEDALIGVAPDNAATIGPLEVEARLFIVDGASLHVFGGTRVRWEEHLLWSSRTAANATIQLHEVKKLKMPKASVTTAPASAATRTRTAKASAAPDWQVALEAPPSAMHVAEDSIAVGGSGGAVELYNANGQKQGRVSLTSAIAVVYLLPRGAVAFGSRDGWLGVAEAGGHIAWKRQLGRGMRQRPRIPSAMLLLQGDLLVGMEDESLFRFTLAGQEIWNVPCQYHAITRLGAVDIDGRPHIIVGTEWGMLDLLDAKGNTIWNKMVGPIASIRSGDLRGTGLQAIACSDWTGIHLLRAADGSALWNANLGGETLDAVPVKRAAEGFDLCAASDIGQVARFEPGGTLVWRSDAQEPLTAMAVGRSVIALGCLSGTVRLYELKAGRLLGMGAMQSPIFKLEAIGPTADRFVGATEDGRLFALSVQV